jgi:CHAT domain-containing protein/tetratricopeptide (TPR) repeat protein
MKHLGCLLFGCLLITTGIAHSRDGEDSDYTDRAVEYNRLGDPESAEIAAREAIARGENKNAQSRNKTGRPRENINAQLQLGVALRRQGRLRESEAILKAALEAAERLQGSNGRLAISSLGHLGTTYTQLGLYAEAEARLRDCLRRVDLGGVDLGPDIWAQSRIQLARLFNLMGRHDEAESLLNAAVARLGDSQGLTRTRHYAQIELARLHLEKNDPAGAEPPAHQALELAEQGWGVKHAQVAESLKILGKSLLKQGHLADAEPFLRRATDIAEAKLGKDNGEAAKSFIALAQLLDKKGDVAEADKVFRRALAGVEHGSSSETLFQALREYATFLSDHERETEATGHFQRAMDLADRLFTQTQGLADDARESLVARMRPIYNLSLLNLLRLNRKQPDAGHDRAALSVASRTQSRLFTEMLRRADVGTHAREPRLAGLIQERDKAGAEEYQLLQKLARIARQDSTGAYVPAKPSNDEFVQERMRGQISELHAAMQRARGRRDDAENALRQEFPSYMDLIEPRPVELATLQGKVLRPGETLLSFFLLAKGMAIFVASPERFKLVSVALRPGEIAELVNAVRRPMEQFNGTQQGLAGLDPGQLNRLYNLLLRPVASLLPRNGRILVAADGPLYTLPLEMLVRSWEAADKARFDTAERESPLAGYATLDYAGEHWQFSYLPSLAALVHQRTQARSATNMREELVAFADPVFDAADLQPAPKTRAALASLGLTRRGQVVIPRLPETADEARAIADIVGGTHELFLRQDAQEKRIKLMDLSGVRYLHFATHGLLGAESSLVSDFQAGEDGTLRNLVLSEEELDAPPPNKTGARPGRPRGQPALVLTLVGDLGGEDGLLTMGEVVDRLRLDAELVSLSACNTAGETENTRNGEGFAGLTRAFMYAGAKGLLVSHWSVDSQTTRDLMVDIFRRVKSGLSAGQAVAQAQSAIRAGDARTASRGHPFYWAPFVYVGAD